MNALVPGLGWAGAALGLLGSLATAVLGLRTQRHPSPVLYRQLRTAVLCVAVGGVVAMAALEVALLTDNFAMSYVARNHARATPLLFTITGAWSALEGSIVLWTLVLAGFTVAVLRQVRGPQDRLGTGALGIMGIVGVFFFGLVTTVANPFKVLSVIPADGVGTNPLLQDDTMVALHPPLLYLGYVGFTVPFAFAMSALLIRQGGVDWLRRTRRSNLVAWSFLSAGLVVGAWWSYKVLGWGGFWAWDPVENAALMPWLVATAFIHSSVVQVKRGMLQAWNFVLVIATFGLTILGTFLTRSSVILSVHAFSQSAVGPLLLGFFVLVVGGAFVLFAIRGERIASMSRPESLASREGAFMVNNLLLSLFAFVVLVGTLYPVVVQAVVGQQVSVGRPFFDRMTVPLSFALLLTMGVGPFTPYRKAAAGVVWARTRVPLLVGSAAVAGLVVAGLRSVDVAAVVLIAVTVGAASVRQLLVVVPDRRPRSFLRVLTGQRAYWGGQLSHLGLCLVAVIIAVSAGLATRTTVTLQRGASATFAGYTLTFTQAVRHPQPDRIINDAHVSFRRGGDVQFVATPRLTDFPNQQLAVGAPSIDSTPRRDIYVALAQYDPNKVTLNLIRYPFMSWLWVGGGLVVAGGFWALAGRTRRSDPPNEPFTPTASQSGPPVVEDDERRTDQASVRA